jgi:hypothetical protein
MAKHLYERDQQDLDLVRNQLTDYLALNNDPNRMPAEERMQYTFATIPFRYRWDVRTRRWIRRKKDLINAIVRIGHVSPARRELHV